jgi:hypothetical protein
MEALTLKFFKFLKYYLKKIVSKSTLPKIGRHTEKFHTHQIPLNHKIKHT